MAKDEDDKALRWRPNCIGLWRDWAGYKQDEVAEYLGELGLVGTHTSVGRIEAGKQMPKIDVIEAMARLYGTDIDSMINRPPPKDGPKFRPPQQPAARRAKSR